MTKVRAPMFSFDARGAIAESLVYFPWKGISAIRSYVIPSNPKTPSQQTQRGYLTAAVTMLHVAQGLATNPFDQDDVTAYSQLGLTFPTPRTWFNMVCKLWMDVMVAGKTPVIYRNATISDPTASSFDCIFYLSEETGSDLAAGKFYFGPSRTALVNSTAATIDPGVSAALANADLSAFLTAGNKYYMQFRPDAADPCEGAESGILSFVAT